MNQFFSRTSLMLGALLLLVLPFGCTEENEATTPAPVTPPVSTTTAPAPTITSFSPVRGKGGDQIVITGANFGLEAASNIVKFNGKVAKVIAANTTTLTVEVPNKAGIGVVSVETSSQTATSGRLFNFYYTATVEKIAGGFTSPQNIAADARGNLYVPDRGTGKIKLIKPGGSVSDIAGSGLAAFNQQIYNTTGKLAKFAVLTGLAVDSKGENLYAVDEYSVGGAAYGFVLKIDLTTTNYAVQQLARINRFHPTNIRLDETNKKLYVNGFSNNQAGLVVTLNTDGTSEQTIIGTSGVVGFDPISSGEIEGTSAKLNITTGAFLTKDKAHYYTTDEHNQAVRQYTVATKKVKTIAGIGKLPQFPEAYLNDQFTNTDVPFQRPSGIVLDSEGRIYVTDNMGHSLFVYDPKSEKWQVLLASQRKLYSIIINDKDELFISEWTGTNDSVIKVTIK